MTDLHSGRPAPTTVGHPLDRLTADEIRTAFALPVHLLDERLTTAEAHSYLDALGRPREGRKDIIDQVAAVLILESFLSLRAEQAARARLRAGSPPPHGGL